MKNNRYVSLIREGLDIVEQRKQDKWVGSKYENLKKAPTTVLGDFGEDLIVDIFKYHGHEAERVNKGIGDYDILVNGKIRIEGKTATEDTHGGFQFNGIKKNGVEYDNVICVGVGPNDLYINMWTKQHCVDHLTTSMTKDGADTYKLPGFPQREGRARTWEVYPLNEENFEKHIIKEIV